MKNKNTVWTAEEDVVLTGAVLENVSAERLCVRLNRSASSIKRRMRELGLRGSRRGPRQAAHSTIQIRIDPNVQVKGWLDACKSGDILALISFYDDEATLECACTGSAIYSGVAAIFEYWSPKLRSENPLRFSLTSVNAEDERVVVDYFGYDAKPVRMYLSFDSMGKIVRSECARNCEGPPRSGHQISA